MPPPPANPGNPEPSPVIGYESGFVQERLARRIRIATWCGGVPLLLLISMIGLTVATQDRRWVAAGILLMLVSHGVVGLGLFLLCLEYAFQRQRLMPTSHFINRSRKALVVLLANWPAFVALVYLASRWP